jgi:hypothetical protein
MTTRWLQATLVLVLALATLASAFAWQPAILVPSNPYPLQTAQYRAMNPYSTPYMTTGFNPLGTTAYAPSYGWTSAYSVRSIRPAPMDRFGPRVVAPYDTTVVWSRKVDDPIYRGAYDARTGAYVNTLSNTRQPPLVRGDSRVAAPATRYPDGSRIRGELSPGFINPSFAGSGFVGSGFAGSGLVGSSLGVHRQGTLHDAVVGGWGGSGWTGNPAFTTQGVFMTPRPFVTQGAWR